MLLMSSFSLGVVAVIHRLIIFLSMLVSFVGSIVCLHFHFVLSIILQKNFLNFIQGPYLEDNFNVPGQDFLNYLCRNFTEANISDHKGWHVHNGRTITARYLYIRLWETNNLRLCEAYVYDDSNGMYNKHPW